MKLTNNIIKNKFVMGVISVTLVYIFIVRPLLKKGDESLLIEHINNKKVNSNLLTITEQEAEDLANQLFIEMDGFNVLINREFWDNVFNTVQTKDDALLVIKKFGIRKGQILPVWLQNEYHLRWLPYRSLLLQKFKV